MKIKICGVTTPEVMQFCADAQVDFVGCVFVEKSPRYIPPDNAKPLIDSIKTSQSPTKTVGLFQDACLHQVVDVALHTGIDYIQLHGSESVDFVNAVEIHTAKPIIKAFGIATPSDFDQAKPYDEVCDTLLFDAKPAKKSTLKGGHGVAFNWNILNTMPPFISPWFLAGGITPENAKIALSNRSVQMIDLSGGVEKAKGVKDIQKIQQLINICNALQK